MKLDIMRRALISALFVGGLAACGDTTDEPDATTGGDTNTETEALSIAETAAADGRFTTLVAALQQAELVDVFAGEGTFTVFAPTDDAFAALPEGLLETLLEDDNKPLLQDILKYHVLGSVVRAGDIAEGRTWAASLQGDNIVIDLADGAVKLWDANVVITDIECSNGVIHVIDAVITPPATIAEKAVANPDFSTLVTALEKADLVSALNGEDALTVFAPTNAAFAALDQDQLAAILDNVPLLTTILTSHVVSGTILSSDIATGATAVDTLSGAQALVVNDSNGVHIGNATVAQADVTASNGVIHVLDEVIVVLNTIALVANTNPNFTRLAAALEATELTQTLNSVGAFTVFAPVDAAFEAIDSTIATLSTEQVRDVLLYHVLGQPVRSTEIATGSVDSLLAGQQLDLVVNNGAVSINESASVVTADVETSNGVIHVIDSVLVPSSL